LAPPTVALADPNGARAVYLRTVAGSASSAFALSTPIPAQIAAARSQCRRLARLRSPQVVGA